MYDVMTVPLSVVIMLVLITSLSCSGHIYTCSNTYYCQENINTYRRRPSVKSVRDNILTLTIVSRGCAGTAVDMWTFIGMSSSLV